MHRHWVQSAQKVAGGSYAIVGDLLGEDLFGRLCNTPGGGSRLDLKMFHVVVTHGVGLPLKKDLLRAAGLACVFGIHNRKADNA